MCDNFHFDITGAPLDKALAIAFTHNRKAVGWTEIAADPDATVHDEWEPTQPGQRKRLVLFWTQPSSPRVDYHPLPAPMNAQETEVFVKAWLNAADYGPEPDHDGSNGKGCRVYNEQWGRVGSEHAAFVAIAPTWEWYGK